MLKFLPAFALLAALATSSVASADEVAWSDDIPTSLKKASDENKDVLMDFTGSDWCSWCMKLHEEVFNKDGFKQEAPKHFVLVEVDFPSEKKLPDAVTKQNEAWQKKFDIKGFPTIMLVDSKGRPFGQMGYQPGGPEAWLKTEEEFRALRVARDEKWAAAAKATGSDKAKLLDEGLDALKNPELVLAYYGAEIDEAIAADTDGKAGIKEKYASKRQAVKDAQENQAKQAVMLKEFKGILDGAEKAPDATIAKLEAIGNKEGEDPMKKQLALFLAAKVSQLDLKDVTRTGKFVDASIAVDPNSQIGKMLAENRARMLEQTE